MSAQAQSFGPAADLYDRVRPDYPDDIIDWMLGAEPRRVVDLGAGTGKLTRRLLARGHEVVAVEPDEQMLARLAATSPGATPLPGSADRIPLPDANVDAVVAGQAYHWFDPETAHPELARVIRPGGVFAPVWNIRDENEPWVAALSAIMHRYGGGQDGSNSFYLWTHADFGEWFGPVERLAVPYTVPMDPDRLVKLVRSRSYYLTASPDQQADMDQATTDLATTHPDLAGRDTFDLPYVTVAYRATRTQG